MIANEKKKVSRVVKKKTFLPAGVTYELNDNNVLFKGPQGELNVGFSSKVSVILNKENQQIEFSSDSLSSAELGTNVVLFRNGMNGVWKKFEKVLNLYGVGYKVLNLDGVLEFFVGYSHSIKITPPSNIDFEIKTPTQIILKSCSKIDLGDFAAKISKIRKVNPYKTKGIIESGAFVVKKEGKK
ncbi:50S ribosomal protein L6 [Alphaproteobacteria bacterium endosymbiont of Tiliacea citrago]|uniref:50S ribosomal protein L6 n=1 Tax=Alphaproteobacteria bacterium endosymbiont of Tiliacea citrago TaxID=3077944 RepID=UPI00313E429B